MLPRISVFGPCQNNQIEIDSQAIDDRTQIPRRLVQPLAEYMKPKAPSWKERAQAISKRHYLKSFPFEQFLPLKPFFLRAGRKTFFIPAFPSILTHFRYSVLSGPVRWLSSSGPTPLPSEKIGRVFFSTECQAFRRFERSSRNYEAAWWCGKIMLFLIFMSNFEVRRFCSQYILVQTHPNEIFIYIRTWWWWWWPSTCPSPWDFILWNLFFQLQTSPNLRSANEHFW